MPEIHESLQDEYRGKLIDDFRPAPATHLGLAE